MSLTLLATLGASAAPASHLLKMKLGMGGVVNASRSPGYGATDPGFKPSTAALTPTPRFLFSEKVTAFFHTLLLFLQIP